MAVARNKIVIVGCGPGGLEYLTPAGRRAIEQAEVLAGAPHLLKTFCDPKKTLIPVGSDIQGALDKIAPHLDHRVAVLVTGDPGLCSLAKPVMARFGRAACRVIPGVSSVQAAFASVGVDWLNARVITAHERLPEMDVAELNTIGKIAILAGGPGLAEWLSNIGKTHQIFLCSNLTLPDESVCEVTAAKLGLAKIPSRTVVLLIRKDLL